MRLIHHHLHHWDRTLPHIAIPVDRLTLAKRRWRGTAEDGSDFGFDLDHPLADGDAIAEAAGAVYYVAQKPEPVLEIAFTDAPAAAARLGWIIGNLHFPLEVCGDVLRTPDDPALRQLFNRERIAYSSGEQVFRPLSGGHSHSHSHEHHHHEHA